MTRWPVSIGVLLLCVGAVHAATLQKEKIGGSGPIDRPTALVSYWCFNEWDCGQFDTFVADGDSALVRVSARNWNSIDPGQALDIKLDNFYVVEQSSFNAELDPVGAADPDYGCASSTDLMLDIDNVLPAGLAYGTKFDGSVGPEWSYDASQVGYSSSGIYEDPFNTAAPIVTGSLDLGNGTGPEFVTAELQLSGLTPGWTYVVSYFWRSADDGVFPANCQPPNDDLEIEIFGESVICTPDLPLIEILEMRTLAWNDMTRILRFQLLIQNVGSGPAKGLDITVEDSDPGVTIIDGDSHYGDLPAAGGPVWTGPFELDLSGLSPGTMGSYWLLFLFQFEDDCGSYGDSYHEWNAPKNTLLDPVSNPGAARSVELRQNTPNPFNPRTTIEFRIETAGMVDLEIFDTRGRMVRRLLHQRLEAGEHDFPWDGRDFMGKVVAAGPYYYRLNANDETTVRKMMLLK